MRVASSIRFMRRPAWLNPKHLRNELGVQDPVGFWDPAGFTADGSVEDFKRRRQTEIKHGRIAMLAAMGYITPEQLICKKSSI